jgi:hypothetical protein
MQCFRMNPTSHTFYFYSGGISRSDVSDALGRNACTPTDASTMVSGSGSYTWVHMPSGYKSNNMLHIKKKRMRIKEFVCFYYYRDSKPFAGFPLPPPPPRLSTGLTGESDICLTAHSACTSVQTRQRSALFAVEFQIF